jgi:hypothetical protein
MNIFEKIFDAVGGRKFLTFIAGTVLLIIDKISPEIWFGVATVYCATNVAQKVLYEKGLTSVVNK